MGRLVDRYMLSFIHIGSRRVFVLGVSANPDRVWMTQQGRNAARYFAEQPLAPKYLLRDNDGKSAPEFTRVGSTQLRRPAQALRRGGDDEAVGVFQTRAHWAGPERISWPGWSILLPPAGRLGGFLPVAIIGRLAFRAGLDEVARADFLDGLVSLGRHDRRAGSETDDGEQGM